MKMKKLWRSRKALSPVIAAIILIAVTVAVSIAVAAWMGALAFLWMGYEELEIPTVKWEWSDTPASIQINITVSNSGTRDVTVDHIEINYVGIANAKVDPNPPFSFTTTDDPKILLITFAYVNGTAYDISVVTSSGYKFTDHFTGGINIPPTA